ncbi:MAG: SAM-dependent DNA methyltransferase [Planctomycetota bacterium]|nr:MAG: SAM-dependent DNA methyltransferase [Planctomycetota bacterium]
MANEKSNLYSSLWASCDELRSGMNASQYKEYKDYVLFMLFIKYVSDKYGNSKDFAPPVSIPKGASFKDMVALKGKPDIGNKISTQIIQPLLDANPPLARSDFPDFNDSNKLGDGAQKVEKLGNLIAIFENPTLDFSQNRAEKDDILGDADPSTLWREIMMHELLTGKDEADQSQAMDPPERLDWPLFVYGALKPGFPAFEAIRALVETFPRDVVTGELWVRDGLPMLRKSDHGSVKGYLLHWKPGQAETGYAAVCAFEPRKHYAWSEVTLETGVQANALVIRYPFKGNPQPPDRSFPMPSSVAKPPTERDPHHPTHSVWNLTDDPAFGPGLEAVERVVKEEEDKMQKTMDDIWPRFFRSQMAYLLLWSILERLSALCFGPGQEPMQRIKRLHELPGMVDLVRLNVQREGDTVSDSRNPDTAYKLDRTNAKKCFAYYYQIRSNLSHRGKGMFNEFDKVHCSLKELLAITQQFLGKLEEQEEQP